MAKVIGILGESGSGKTSAMRTLDPKSTFYFDCDKKGLSWKGWKSQYSTDKKNYCKTDFPQTVLNLLEKINKQDDLKHIKTVVIDTINGVMVSEEMRNLKQNGYGKWTDLASYVWNVFDFALSMRDDLTVVIVCHSITDSDDNGVKFTHIRTNGRKLEKIVLESKLTTVLLASVNDKGEHVFRTHGTAFDSVKSPIGAFEKDEVPNDMAVVLKALEDF